MSAPEWLERALADPTITDICINGGGSAFADSGAGLQPLAGAGGGAGFASPEELRAWVLEQLSLAGRTWDARHPFADAVLRSGHRLHVAFPPIARDGLLVSLRRLSRPEPRSPERAGGRWEGCPRYETLRQATLRGDSILISGATGAGKTTLASDLLGEVPAQERIIALEDTPELGPRHPHFVSLVSRPANADGCGEVTLRALLRQCLRMRPDRIILGECRGGEVLDLLQALNTGHRGAMATLHANSPRDALRRIELLCLLASGGTVPSAAIRELLAHGVQWVAQVARAGSSRRVSELWRLEGREGDTILMRPVLSHP